MAIQSARNVTVDSEFIKILLVGDNGTGKSIFAASSPIPGFVFDFSNGILTYRGKDFDYAQYEMTAKGWLEYEKDHLNIIADAKSGKYQTVIIDDQTAMEGLAMQRALSLDPKRSDSGGPLWNVHYQMVRNLIEGRLRQLLSLPCNVILISHTNITRDDKTGSILRIDPLMIGQLPTIITGLFDEVYYASTRKEGDITKWVLQTVPIGLIRARSRLSGKEHLLPNFIENDWNILMKEVKKARTTVNKDAEKAMKQTQGEKK